MSRPASASATFEDLSRSRLGAAVAVLFLLPACLVAGQSASPGARSAVSLQTPQSWAQAAAEREVQIIEDDGSFPLSYRIRKIEDKGDTTREVIETKEGAVARLVERDGRLLTRQQDQDERGRLDDTLSHPDDFLKHHKRDSAMRSYSVNLVQLFPHAMLFRFAPGQPSGANNPSGQLAIDFEPDTNFRPPTMISDLLTGLEGRLWIDVRTHTLTRVQAHVIRPVNFGWGVLARIHTGGTVEFEQVPVGENRWVYSRVEDHLEMREVMIHTTEQNVRMSAWNFRLLPKPVSFQEAVHLLLALPVPLLP